MPDAPIVYAMTQPGTPPGADALRVQGFFLPAPGQDTATWWRDGAAGPDFVGYWRDVLAEAAARHPACRSVSLAGRDGRRFMGLVRDA